MIRGIKLVGAALLLGAASLSLAACSTHQVASCTGAYPPGAAINDTSPYSRNASPYQPDCQQY